LKYDLEKLHSGIFQIITNINNNYQQYISFLDKPSLFVLGKGKYYFIAKEAALKIKELTYNHAEGYSGSALKHGAYSLLTDQFPVILIIMDDEYKSLMLSCYEEIKSRNAYILVITDIVDTDFENKIIIPKNNLSEIYIIIVLQYLSFYIAKSKNLSIDRPRNLAKCVTTD
jgi:glucosamine--fructose-6-phosphate aminotransferase (isomerizing)